MNQGRRQEVCVQVANRSQGSGRVMGDVRDERKRRGTGAQRRRCNGDDGDDEGQAHSDVGATEATRGFRT